jgi:hypothetical protein
MKIKSLLSLICILSVIAVNAQQWGWATLIAPQNSTTVTLIDTNSQVIKTWTGLSGQTAYSCYLMPGGYLWRSVKTTNNSFSGGGLAGRVQKVDWNGTVLFDYTISNTNEISHHDICPMPNGDVMLIVYEKKTGTQMQAAGGANTARQLEKIMQLHPTGTNTATVVWQWNLYDHLCQNTNVNGANYVSSIVNNPQLMNVNFSVMNDWWHMNGIDYNEDLDQVVVSAHNMHELYVIDHSTTTVEAAGHTGGVHGKGGDFLYRWGNPQAYSATGTKIFNVIHDSHWIPADCPKAGWLVGMNNKGVSNSASAVDMWQSTWNGSSYTHTLGQQYQPASYGFRHPCQNQNNTGAGYTSNMGNSQQLPNGNMLVCLATAGDVYEVDSNGNQLWFYSLSSGSLAHAYRHTRCYIENTSASISNVSPAVCANSSTPLLLNATASATNVTNYTYSWSPATGLSSTTVASPSVTNISSPTTYTVTVNTGNCTATASVTVNINQQPTADAGQPVTIASGSSTTLTATGGSSFAWSNGENTASVTVSPIETTTYTVTVTNAQGCTAIDDVVVTVSGGNLTVNVNAVNDAFCLGGSTLIAATVSGGSGNYTYQWSDGSTTQAITATPQSANPNLVYSVTVSDGASTVSGAATITVYPLPIVTLHSDTTIQAGGTALLSATGAQNYLWSTGASTQNINVTPLTTITYSVTGTDVNLCTATDQAEVTVIGGVLSVAVSATDSSICEGESSQLFATASGGSGTYTYSWSSSPSGFTSSIFNPYINPTNTTVYSVTVSDGTVTATASLSIVVLSLPAQPTVTQNDTLLVSSSPANNVWFFYGNPTGDVTQTIVPTLHGSYQVQVIGANGCASPLSDPYEYFPTSIVDDIDLAKYILVYPNPAKDMVLLSGAALNENFTTSIHDCTGRAVLNSIDKKQISVAELSGGVYVLVIETPQGKVIKRLVVSK